MSPFHPLTVAAVEPQTRDAVAVRFTAAPAHAEAFRYTHGQHLTLRTDIDGEDVRRSYSICSGEDDGDLRVAIKRVPGGVFSNWANDHLQPGMTIEAMPPAGRFGTALSADNARHYVAFAAGSGITPILSIVKTVLAAEPASRVTLVYGNRTASSVLFKNELEDLKDRFLTRFSLVFVLSREALDIDLFHGRIDEARVGELLDKWIDPTGIDMAFACGPLDMMQGVVNALTARGVSADRIKRELFATSAHEAQQRLAAGRAEEAAAVPDGCEIRVVMDGRSRRFTHKGGRQNLVDAAAASGIELPFSCKAGVCSTCRCKVTAGEVDMNAAYALEDYEIERGFTLACQSFPLSGQITIDFDQET